MRLVALASAVTAISSSNICGVSPLARARAHVRVDAVLALVFDTIECGTERNPARTRLAERAIDGGLAGRLVLRLIGR